MRAPFTLALLAVLVVVAPAAHAQWKWRDAQGKVTVSDRPPPPDVPQQSILSRPASAERRERVPSPAERAASDAAGSPAAKPITSVDPEIEARRKKIEQDNAAKTREAEEKQAAVMKENCSRARAQMTSLDSGARITRSNDKGEREVLDEAQRAAEAARTREAITANCKS